MSLLYVNENGTQICIEGNQFVAKHLNGMRQIIPAETLEGITLLGAAQMTTKCMEQCMERGIPVSFFSKGGKYFGRLVSTGHVRAGLQRKQCALYDTGFVVDFSKRIIDAKIRNQEVVMKRYAKSQTVNVENNIRTMHICRNKLCDTNTIQEISGYEGYAAKTYFEGLSMCIDKAFQFSGRSKRPPKDEFNSMISLGYSILLNEIYSEIEIRGLNPYFGFMHRDAEKHPTLASDLIEEWRAVMIDATVMSMINGHEIDKDEFVFSEEDGKCMISRSGIKKFLNKLEKKLQTDIRYLDYIDYRVSFRRAIGMQVSQLIKAIEAEDASLYHPIIIR